MQLGIRLHPAFLSLSDTICVPDTFGVKHARSTVHNRVQKADLQPASGASPDHVAVGDIVIQLNDDQYWLYAAVNPASNRLLYVRLYSTRNTGVPRCS